MSLTRSIAKFALALLFCLPELSNAQWPTDPVSGRPITTSPSPKGVYRFASDGFKGEQIVWGGGDTLRAQRIDSFGTLLWGSLGHRLSSSTLLSFTQIIPDGTGGALVV